MRSAGLCRWTGLSAAPARRCSGSGTARRWMESAPSPRRVSPNSRKHGTEGTQFPRGALRARPKYHTKRPPIRVGASKEIEREIRRGVEFSLTRAHCRVPGHMVRGGSLRPTRPERPECRTGGSGLTPASPPPTHRRVCGRATEQGGRGCSSRGGGGERRTTRLGGGGAGWM